MGGPSAIRTGAKRRWTLWLAGGLVIVTFVFGVVAYRHSASTRSAHSQRLIGRWLRPDGGYVLEIRSAAADGQLVAAYFNPRPIRVAEATYRRQSGDVLVFVELQDINYPGSTYSLRYLPGRDRLVGEYFQALQRQTFDVEFIRSN